jgi:hypothetical protein
MIFKLFKRIIFHELKNYEIKHRVMKTEDDNKLISIKKSQYYIPMYTDDRWEKDLTNERFISKKIINSSFIMTKQVLENLKNRPSIIDNTYLNKNTFVGNMAKSNMMKNTVNTYIHSTNLLRIPENEISKEILIEKFKKEEENKHPIKRMARELRNQNEE